MHAQYKCVLQREYDALMDTGAMPHQNRSFGSALSEIMYQLDVTKDGIRYLATADKLAISPEEEAMSLEEWRIERINALLRRIWQLAP